MNKKLKKSLRKFDKSKKDAEVLISGELGITINGSKLVEVPNRKGFVYVRLKGNTSELIQAYNATVAPVYDLPVFVVRSNGIYKIVGRNIDRNQNQWGTAPYLPKHGAQHSFNKTLGIGGDVVWVWSQQFMPLLSYPSGTDGGMMLSVEPHFYEWNGSWRYAQNTGTPDYTPHLPTTTGSARMVLSYIDPSDNSIKLVPGTPFSGLITGSAQVAQYIPDIPREVGIPLAAVRLTTGTTTIGWENIYDLRDFYTVGKPSGSVGGGGGGIDTIGFAGMDEGVPLGTGTVLNVTGAGATFSRSGTVFNLDVPGGVGGGGGAGVMAWDEGSPLGTGTILNFTGAGVVASISGSVLNINVSSSAFNNPYFQYKTASLEPDALYPFLWGTFNYTVTGTSPQMILASYFTQMGNTGRMEVRDPKAYMLLASGTVINGMSSTSSMILLNPQAPTYADAFTKYYDRLNTLANTKQRKVDILAAGTKYPLLMGAYGGIITRVVCFDYDFIIIANNAGVNGINLMNEENDGTTQREDSALNLAVNKYVATEVIAGAGGSGKGTIVFNLCPSDWSVIADNTSYQFRDDFMGASLSSKWSVSGTALQINQTYQWTSVSGTSTWGANGAYSNTSVSRASGTMFIADVYTGRNATSNNSHMFGFSDGLGHSYTNFSHGVLFTSNGASNIIGVYENGNYRGQVGVYDDGTIYRVRITITGNNAKYEIQGSALGALGGPNWTNITPGTTSSSTTPLRAGISVGQTGIMYVGDVKII